MNTNVVNLGIYMDETTFVARAVTEKIDKMKEIVKAKSDAELARFLGISTGSISMWRQRGTIPYKNILHFCDKTNVDKDIVLFKQENEEITEEIEQNLTLIQEPKQQYSKTVTKSNTHPIIIEVPYFTDVYASAGAGATNYNIKPQIVRLNSFMLDQLKVINPKNLELINITGESMEPYFQSGDIAIVERIHTPDQIKNGNTIILNYQGDIFIKQIEKIPGKQTIILKSKNPLYEDTIIKSIDEIEPIAIVRGRLSTF